ncbi:titin-like [Lucilia sericata]|uniref:titin-like n=1 Tax=Lucilia sericata TaxID=13632 RepID=UPI0018A82B6A|nr:titin-like [Lucilia sericata]
MQQRYDVIAALSYTLDPHSVVATSSSVSMMLKPSKLGLTYAEVLGGHSSPNESQTQKSTSPVYEGQTVTTEKEMPKVQENVKTEEYIDEFGNKRTIITTTTKTTTSSTTTTNLPNEYQLYKARESNREYKENVAQHELKVDSEYDYNVPTKLEDPQQQQQQPQVYRQEPQVGKHHIQVPREQQRGRSPRRKQHKPTQRHQPSGKEQTEIKIETTSTPHYETKTSVSEQHTRTTTTQLLLPEQDRARSKSPIWVPGSTSYAEVLRGLELERLRQQSLKENAMLQQQQQEQQQPQYDLQIETRVIPQETVTEKVQAPLQKPTTVNQTEVTSATTTTTATATSMLNYYTENVQPSSSSASSTSPLQQESVAMQEIVSTHSLTDAGTTYTSTYNTNIPMTAEEIQATYLQPDLKLYQSMYENLTDSEQWGYVTPAPVVPVQQSPSDTFYEQMMQVQYTQPTAMTTTYTGYQYPTQAAQYQLVAATAGYYNPQQTQTPTEAYHSVYAPTTEQMYYNQQAPQSDYQQYAYEQVAQAVQQQQQQQQQPQTETYQNVLNDPLQVESTLNNVETTLASMIQQTTVTSTTTTTHMQTQQEEVALYEPQEIQVEEPIPDITFGQFDINEIENIPQENTMPQTDNVTPVTESIVETVPQTQAQSQTQTHTQTHTQEYVTYVPEPAYQQQAQIVEKPEPQIAGTTYAEVLFGLKHGQHFQPSSQQQVHVKVMQTTQPQQIKKPTTTTSNNQTTHSQPQETITTTLTTTTTTVTNKQHKTKQQQHQQQRFKSPADHLHRSGDESRPKSQTRHTEKFMKEMITGHSNVYGETTVVESKPHKTTSTALETFEKPEEVHKPKAKKPKKSREETAKPVSLQDFLNIEKQHVTEQHYSRTTVESQQQKNTSSEHKKDKTKEANKKKVKPETVTSKVEPAKEQPKPEVGKKDNNTKSLADVVKGEITDLVGKLLPSKKSKKDNSKKETVEAPVTTVEVTETKVVKDKKEKPKKEQTSTTVEVSETKPIKDKKDKTKKEQVEPPVTVAPTEIKETKPVQDKKDKTKKEPVTANTPTETSETKPVKDKKEKTKKEQQPQAPAVEVAETKPVKEKKDKNKKDQAPTPVTTVEVAESKLSDIKSEVKHESVVQATSTTTTTTTMKNSTTQFIESEKQTAVSQTKDKKTKKAPETEKPKTVEPLEETQQPKSKSKKKSQDKTKAPLEEATEPKPQEKSSEKTVEKVTEPSTKPQEKSSKKTVEKVTEPSDKPQEKPSEKLVEVVEEPQEKPSEKTVEEVKEPSTKPQEKPSEKIAKVVEEPQEKPSEKTVKEVTEPFTKPQEKPSETTLKVVEEPQEKLFEKIVKVSEEPQVTEVNTEPSSTTKVTKTSEVTESGAILTTTTVTKHIKKRIVKIIVDGQEQIIEEEVVDDAPQENVTVEKINLPESADITGGSVTSTVLKSGGTVTKTVITKTKRLIKRILENGEEIVEEVMEDEPQVEQQVTELPTTTETIVQTVLEDKPKTEKTVAQEYEKMIKEPQQVEEVVQEPKTSSPKKVKGKKDKTKPTATAPKSVEPENGIEKKEEPKQEVNIPSKSEEEHTTITPETQVTETLKYPETAEMPKEIIAENQTEEFNQKVQTTATSFTQIVQGGTITKTVTTTTKRFIKTINENGEEITEEVCEEEPTEEIIENISQPTEMSTIETETHSKQEEKKEKVIQESVKEIIENIKQPSEMDVIDSEIKPEKVEQTQEVKQQTPVEEKPKETVTDTTTTIQEQPLDTAFTQIVQGGTITKTFTTITKRIIKRINENGEEIIEEVIDEEPKVTQMTSELPTTVKMSENIGTNDLTSTTTSQVTSGGVITRTLTTITKRIVKRINEKGEEVIEEIYDEEPVVTQEVSKLPTKVETFVMSSPQEETQIVDNTQRISESTNTAQVIEGGTITRTLTTITKRIIKRINSKGEEITEEVYDEEPQVTQEICELPITTKTVTVPATVTSVSSVPTTTSITSSQVIQGGKITKTLTTTTKRIITRINEHGEEVTEEVIDEEPVVTQEVTELPITTEQNVVKTQEIQQDIPKPFSAPLQPFDESIAVKQVEEKESVPVSETPESTTSTQEEEEQDGGVIKTTIIRTTKKVKKIKTDETETTETDAATKLSTEVVEDEPKVVQKPVKEEKPQPETIKETKTEVPTETSEVNDNTDEVIKKTIVRTTKIVKKISQNTEHESVSQEEPSQQLRNVESPNLKVEEPTNITEPSDAVCVDNESGGVVKTTTIRTTKIVKRKPQDEEVSEEQSSETQEEPEQKLTIVEEPSEVVSVTNQMDGAIIKTTTIRTMRIIKKISQDGRIVLEESDTPDDVIVKSSIEMPDQTPSPSITRSSSSTSVPIVDSPKPHEIVLTGLDNISTTVENPSSPSGIRVLGIETVPVTITQNTSTLDMSSLGSSSTTTTTTTTTSKMSKLTMSHKYSFESDDGKNVVYVGDDLGGKYPPGSVQKISLITHEEKLKNPIVKMHLDLPEVSLKVTETVTDNYEHSQRDLEQRESEEKLIMVSKEEKPQLVEDTKVIVEETHNLVSEVSQETEETVKNVEQVSTVVEQSVVEQLEESKKEIVQNVEDVTTVVEQVSAVENVEESKKLDIVEEKVVEQIKEEIVMTPEEESLFKEIQRKLAKKDKKKRPALPEEFLMAEATKESSEPEQKSVVVESEVINEPTVIPQKQEEEQNVTLLSSTNEIVVVPKDESNYIDKCITMVSTIETAKQLATNLNSISPSALCYEIPKYYLPQLLLAERSYHTLIKQGNEQFTSEQTPTTSTNTNEQVAEVEKPYKAPLQPFPEDKTELNVTEDNRELSTTTTVITTTTTTTTSTVTSSDEISHELSTQNNFYNFEVPKYNIGHLNEAEKVLVLTRKSEVQPKVDDTKDEPAVTSDVTETTEKIESTTTETLVEQQNVTSTTEIVREDISVVKEETSTELDTVTPEDVVKHFEVPKYDLKSFNKAESQMVLIETPKPVEKETEIETPEKSTPVTPAEVDKPKTEDIVDVPEKPYSAPLQPMEEVKPTQPSTAEPSTVETEKESVQNICHFEVPKYNLKSFNLAETQMILTNISEAVVPETEIKSEEVTKVPETTVVEPEQQPTTEQPTQTLISETVTEVTETTQDILQHFEVPKYDVKSLNKAESQMVISKTETPVKEVQIESDKTVIEVSEKPTPATTEEPPLQQLQEVETTQQVLPAEPSTDIVENICHNFEVPKYNVVSLNKAESHMITTLKNVVQTVEQTVISEPKAEPEITEKKPEEKPLTESTQTTTTEEKVIEVVSTEIKEAPKEETKPAYAGLPVDESTNAWMDVIDEPMVFSDDEEETTEPEKVTEVEAKKPEEKPTSTESVQTTTVEKVVEVVSAEIKEAPKEETKPAYAGLPVDESTNAWMDVIDEPMVFSDDDEEEITKTTETVITEEKHEVATAEDVTQTVSDSTKTVEISEKPEKLESETKKPFEAPLEPITTTEVKETPKDVSKPAYAGLPVDESTNAWMDVIDEPMVFSDDEEETTEPEKVTAIETEKPEDKPVTETTTEVVSTDMKEAPKDVTKPAYAGLPVDESTNAWMDVIDEPMVLSDDEEEVAKSETTTEVETTETVITQESKITEVERTVVEKDVTQTDSTETIEVSEKLEKLETETSKPFDAPLEQITSVEPEKVYVVKTIKPEEEPVTQPEVVPTEIKETPKDVTKPAYAGLPVDESTNAWMDVIDEPMVFSDDEEEETTEPEKVAEVEEKKPEEKPTTESVQTIAEEKVVEEVSTVIKETPKDVTKPAYAGLPVDESTNAWMDVIDEPMVLSDDEEEVAKSETTTEVKTTETVITQESKITEVETTVVEKDVTQTDSTETIEVSEKPEKLETETSKPFDAPLEQITSVEPEKVDVVETIKPEEKPVTQPEVVPTEIKETPKDVTKPAYAGLPVDESTNAWMDVIDEPMVFSDDEEETTEPEKVAEVEEKKPEEKPTTESVQTTAEEKKPEEKPTTESVQTTTEEKVDEEVSTGIKETPKDVSKPAYAGLPVDESTNAWMDVIDEPMVFSDDEEEITKTTTDIKTTETVITQQSKITEEKHEVATTVVEEDVTKTVTDSTKTIEVAEKPEKLETESNKPYDAPLEPLTAQEPKAVDDEQPSDIVEKPLPTMKQEVETIVETTTTSTEFIETLESEDQKPTEDNAVITKSEDQLVEDTSAYTKNEWSNVVHDEPKESIQPVFKQTQWTDTPDEPIDHQQDEKTIIDTWSSVLEDNTPSISSIALTSKLSPNAPEFTPSYLRHAFSDQTHTFLANERIYNEFVPRNKQATKPRRQEKPQHSAKPKKHSKSPKHSQERVPKPEKVEKFSDVFETVQHKTTEVYEPEPKPVFEETNVWQTIPHGKTYADILLGENGQPLESQPTTIVTTKVVKTEEVLTQERKESGDKKSPKVHEPKVIETSEVKTKTTKKEKPKKEKKPKQAPVKPDETVKDIKPTVVEPEKVVEVSETKEQHTENKDKTTVSKTEFSWASLVQKPGEWIDNTLLKKQKPEPEEKKEEPKETKKPETKKTKPKKQERKEHKSPVKPAVEEEVLEKPTAEVIETVTLKPEETVTETQETTEVNTSTWASLVKRPGEWVDVVAAKATSVVTKKPEVKPVEKTEPKKKSKDKKPKSETKLTSSDSDESDKSSKKQKKETKPKSKDVSPAKKPIDDVIEEPKPIVQEVVQAPKTR